MMTITQPNTHMITIDHCNFTVADLVALINDTDDEPIGGGLPWLVDVADTDSMPTKRPCRKHAAPRALRIFGRPKGRRVSQTGR